MKPPASFCHVVAAHREPILNAGIAEILRQYEGISVGVSTGLFPFAGANLVITDCSTGLDICSTTPVLIVDGWPGERTLRGLFEAGIKNYVLQHSTAIELHTAVRTLLSGGNYLSPNLLSLVLQLHSLERPTQREAEVLELLAKGYCNKKIASCLGIQYDTVKTHVKSLLSKLGASSRTEALALAVQRGMIEIDAD